MIPRAFVALPLCPELVDGLCAATAELARRLDRPARVRWLPRSMLHLTLSFLGRVDDAQLAAVKEGLERLTATAAPFRYAVPLLTGFPSVARPRVVAAPIAPCPALVELARGVWELAARSGLPVEARPFRGHVTVGRPRGGRLRLPRDPVTVGAACGATELVLYRSDLKPEGAQHSVLERYPLRGDGTLPLQE